LAGLYIFANLVISLPPWVKQRSAIAELSRTKPGASTAGSSYAHVGLDESSDEQEEKLATVQKGSSYVLFSEITAGHKMK
jgi:hypothetical protein